MFDPNKLDLDLDNLWEENNTLDKPTNKDKKELKEEFQSNNSSETSEKQDVLENIEVETPETKSKEDTKIEEPTIKEENNEEDTTSNIEKANNSSDNSTNEEKEKIIYDININSLNSVLGLLIDETYDYVIFEPSEEYVKISFRKDEVDKDIRYIKYPIYNGILLKAKAATKLQVEETNKSQQGKQEVWLSGKTYEISSKTSPSENWEKLFLKAKKTNKEKNKAEVKKTPISKILWFLWATSFISLVLGWAFITFVVLNARSVEDVKFFYSLWINLNDINTFITKVITVIFSILLLIETLALIIYLFKFSITKKEYKKKKVALWIVAALLLIITFVTTSAWMIIDRKVKSLPNWQEMAYWDIQVYDNSKLISEKFDKAGSLLTDTNSLIWPVTIKYDLSFFSQKESQKWFKIKKFIWDFWDDDIKETLNPVEIKTFDKIWTYDVSLIVQEVDLNWKEIEKKVENIPSINISHMVDIKEDSINSWGKIVEFDATNVWELWKIEWYLEDDLTNPAWKWSIFKPGKPIFEETLIWMYIRRDGKDEEKLDKVFIISGEDNNSIDWEIVFERSIINDLEYEIKVTNIENAFWDGYIKEFNWIIENKKIKKEWDIENPELSSKLKHTFERYWKHEIKVSLKNSNWDSKELNATIDIPKKLKIKNPLKIYNNNEILEEIRYEKNIWEYFIDELGVPTKLKLDARLIRSDNLLYSLKKVEWDFGDDWNIDKEGKLVEYDLNIEWNDSVRVKYTFNHRKIDDDVIEVEEYIYIEAIKKEALLDLKIEKDSQYTPVVVRFDASKSQVKNEDIVKFIWDFGDWIITEWDWVVPGHKYNIPWDYDIKLKVVTESWKEFSIEKKLILKPKPQSAQISTSLKKAPIWQWIDFSSDKSEGQIIWYFWDFGDWNKSVEANPTHEYSKAWIYNVKLKLDFANNNILEDEIEIEVYE